MRLHDCVPFTYITPKDNTNRVLRIENVTPNEVYAREYFAPSIDSSSEVRINLHELSDYRVLDITNRSVWKIARKTFQRRKVIKFEYSPLIIPTSILIDGNQTLSLNEAIVLSNTHRDLNFQFDKQAKGPFYDLDSKASFHTNYSNQQKYLGWLQYYSKLLTDVKQGTYSFIDTKYQYMEHQRKSALHIFRNRHNHDRWLIADDIGIGKTVTCCHLINLITSTTTDAKVCCVVPIHLLEHWRTHIQEFGLNELQIHICSFESGCPEPNEPLMLTIIDEAHLYMSTPGVPQSRMRQSFPGSQLVVYLSATPSSIDDSILCNLLSAIDPVSYPFGEAQPSLDHYRKRRVNLPDVAKEYNKHRINPVANVSQLRDITQRLLSMGVVVEDNSPLTNKTIDSLLIMTPYIIENYRLTSDMNTRNPYMRVFETTPIYYQVDKTRFDVIRRLFDSPAINELNPEQITNLLSTMTALGSTFIETVSDFLPLEIAMTQDEMEQVQADDHKRLEKLTEHIEASFRRDHNYSVVLFISKSEDREVIVRNILKANIPYCRIGKPTKSGIGDANVIVCSRFDEMGLSLESFSHLIHVDIPVDINRIDQRIGRLDRFGRQEAHQKSAVKVNFCIPLRGPSINPTDNPDNFPLQYYTFLVRGFGEIDGANPVNGAAKDRVSKYSLSYFSLNFCAPENTILDRSLGKISKSIKHNSWLELFNSAQLRKEITQWNQLANNRLKIIMDKSDPEDVHIARINNSLFAKDKKYFDDIELWIAKWNKQVPFIEFQIVSNKSDIRKLTDELQHLLCVCDYGFPLIR